MNLLMGKDQLIQVANMDSPSGVDVPPTWRGLLSWAVIRFGVGIAIAAVFGIMLKEVYRDMRSDRQELLSAYLSNSETLSKNLMIIQQISNEQTSQAKAIESQTRAIEALSRAIQDLK